MSFFQDREWKRILQLLTGATSANNLGWSSDPSKGANVFTTGLVDDSIYVIKPRDSDGEFPFVLEVSNSKGVVLDSFEAVGYDPQHIQDDEDFNSMLLDELYTRIRRQLSGAADAYDSITSSLQALQQRSPEA